MKTKTIYLTVRVDYSYDEKVANSDRDYTAASMAINPNCVSIVDGVSIDSVEFDFIEEE